MLEGETKVDYDQIKQDKERECRSVGIHTGRQCVFGVKPGLEVLTRNSGYVAVRTLATVQERPLSRCTAMSEVDLGYITLSLAQQHR